MTPEPTSPGGATAAAAATAPPAPAPAPPRAAALPGDRVLARLRRLRVAERSAVRAALVVAGLLVTAFFVLRPTFPNFDSYYTLIWADEIANGALPDYDVLRSPTPHPLSTLMALVLWPFGEGADRALVALTLGAYVVLLLVLYRLTRSLVGPLVAVAALLSVLTRTDLALYATRGIFDLFFLVLVFAAALVEVRRPRAGWPVLALLALAGLLRPEAWVIAGLYWLWLAYGAWQDGGRRLPAGEARRGLVRDALLVASAPLIWFAADAIVTGEPLYSLTSTRDVAGQFGRQRTLTESIGLIPDYVGSTEKVLNVGAGGLGALYALVLLKRRAAVPLALGLVGLGTFLAIAVAGLSVIPRYLIIPSIVLNLCVGVAFLGWTLADDRRLRIAGIGIAVVSLALLAWRAPHIARDFRVLNYQTAFVKTQHQDLKAVLEAPGVLPRLRTCGPITVPTHSSIPVIRWSTGLTNGAIDATINQDFPPFRGLLFVGRTYNFEPSTSRRATARSKSNVRRWWSNFPLPVFDQVGRERRWTVLEACRGED